MKTRLTAAAIALSLLLTGCGLKIPGLTSEDDTPAVPMRHELPLPALFADVPESFERTSSEDIDKYYVCGDASIVFMEDSTPCKDLYEYAINALVEYQKVARSIDNTKDNVITGDNLLVQTLEFDCVLIEDDGPNLHVLVGYVTDTASVFTVTCKSAPDTFESHREEFVETLRSLRIDRSGTK